MTSKAPTAVLTAVSLTVALLMLAVAVGHAEVSQEPPGGVPQGSGPVTTIHFDPPGGGWTEGSRTQGITRLFDDITLVYREPVSFENVPVVPLLLLTGLAFAQDERLMQQVGPLQQGTPYEVLTWLGDGTVALALSQALGVRDPSTGRLATTAVAFAGLNAQMLKILFGRGRPDVTTSSRDFRGPFSFDDRYQAMPSGHTAVAFALATVLAERYPRQASWFYLVAGLVGVSRVELLQHWPSDVVAGALLGAVSARQAMRALNDSR